MSNTACTVLGLASWFIVVLLALAVFRVYTSVARRKAANTFAADGSDVPGLGQRLTRVHANCYENIPVFIGVLLFAMATNQTAVTDPTACWLLYARMAQSTVHAISTSLPAVLVRFALFGFQVALIVCWLWQMASHA